MAGMRDTFRVINKMVEDGAIHSYAVAGAVAALNYIEPALTEDVDVLISVEEAQRSGLMTLEPIFAYLRELGYAELRKEGIVIEGWPVQLLPVTDALDAEGLAQAVETAIDGAAPIKIRILRAEHVVATAMKVGRPKDRGRVAQFLAERAVDLDALRGVLDRHDLRDAWTRFCREAGMANPFALDSRP
jgi:hypothetical protein